MCSSTKLGLLVVLLSASAVCAREQRQHAGAVVATKLASEVDVAVDPFSLGCLIAGIVLLVANIGVEIYKAVIMAKFDRWVKGLQETVANEISTAVAAWSAAMDEFQGKQKELIAAANEIAKEKPIVGIIGKSPMFTVGEGKLGVQEMLDNKGSLTSTEEKIEQVMGSSMASINKIASFGIHYGADKLIEKVAEKVLTEAAAKTATQVLSILGLIKSLAELGLNIKAAWDLKKQLKTLKPYYLEETVQGPGKGMYGALHGGLAVVGGLKDQAAAVLAPLATGFTSNDDLNCGEFRSAPAPPAETTMKPICAIYAPGVFHTKGCRGADPLDVELEMGSATGRSSSQQTRASMRARLKARASHHGQQRLLGKTLMPKSRTLDEHSRMSSGFPCHVRQPALTDDTGVVRAEEGGTCADGMHPLSSMQAIYGGNMDEHNGWYPLAGQKFRAISTIGQFGMRLFLPIVISKESSEALWRTIKNFPESTKKLPRGPGGFSGWKSDLKKSDATPGALMMLADDYMRWQGPFSDEFKSGEPVIEAHNFIPKAHNNNGIKQNFMLYTRSEGAPVTGVKKSCTTAELKGCSNDAAYGTCGWRRIPFILYHNSETVPKTIHYCFLNNWHISALQGVPIGK